MPIRPEHRWLYPIDWPEITNFVRFVRAKGRCEQCRRPHGHYAAQLADADGVWWDRDARAWCDGRGRPLRSQPAFVALENIRMTRRPVYLATAHLNHDPSDSGRRWRNLAAFCPRCHMKHDADEHRRRRWWNAFRRRAVGDLFNGRYSD
ncbi:hypothetical protein EWE75_15675 [Sphingomonas populi]|uniref:Uncharacterized protein n=1 Tax=Sphingomonas populi TaxID=2484750 RepID=A0A4Q6XSM1_9SPHN|nr:hypothetical protein [Sphingomonas populi]RZF63483.1 hypothetical protein EWE75_15675 [Sphingomonas populi]